jgi:hypothetical protein
MRSLSAPGVDEWLMRKVDCKAIMRKDGGTPAVTARVHVMC